ncbi:MAG: hypothetical protein RR394_09635, partial [Oscillospiraceae bacterium]
MKINNTAKRISCLLLAVCLLFCGFAHVLHTPADAVAVTATASVIALAVALFGWLGISFASVDAATKTTEEFVGIHPDALTFLMAHMASAGPGGGGTNPNLPGKAVLGVAITAQLVKFLTDAKNFFNAKGEGTIDVVDPNFGVVGDVKFTRLTEFASAQEAYAYAPYSGKVYNESNPLVISVNGVSYKYFISKEYCYLNLHVGNSPSVICGGPAYSHYDNVMNAYCLCDSHHNIDYFVDFRFGFRLIPGNIDYLHPYIAAMWVDARGIVQTEAFVPSFAYNDCVLPISGLGVTDVKTKVPYNSSSLYDNQTILDTLTKQLEKQGSLTVDYQKTLTAIENNQDAQIKLDQQQLLTDIGIKTTLDEIKANQPKPEDDMNVPKLPS